MHFGTSNGTLHKILDPFTKFFREEQKALIGLSQFVFFGTSHSFILKTQAFACRPKQPGESKSSRGGVRNKAKDVVDIDHLVDLWMDLSKKGCEVFSCFGEYQGVWAECAPRPGLVDMVDMARSIAKVSPGLQVKYGDLKEAAVACMHKDQSMKPCKTDTVQEASRKIADKLVIIQKHFRVVALHRGFWFTFSICVVVLTICLFTVNNFHHFKVRTRFDKFVWHFLGWDPRPFQTSAVGPAMGPDSMCFVVLKFVCLQ